MGYPTLPLARLPHWWARLREWRPGIALQLGIAFIGVTALAAVANFAVQRTISITTTRVLPAEGAGVQLHPPYDRPSLVFRAAQKQPAADGRAVLPALERLSDAVQATGLTVPAAERQQRARAATAELRLALERLHGSGRPAEAALDSGRQIINIDAERVLVLEEHSAVLARLQVRLQVAMDKAWKVLGRVVARQSLVTTTQRFEELKRRSELLRNDAYTAADVELLEAVENQFGAALADGERGLTRSEGPEWYELTRNDLARITELRTRLVSLDLRRRGILPQFRSEIARVRTQLQRPASIPEPESDDPDGGHAAAGHSRWQNRFADPPWETRHAVTTREETVNDGIARAGLAWLSVGVPILLLAVSILTVLSILRPVQRLIAATQRIAMGESGVRVQQLGSRELDRLATAFNSMAAQLEGAHAVARSYQQQLESRVAERTRQLKYQADHDALTRLPNRRQLFDQLGAVLLRAGQARRSAALFFIDLDNFKNINDGRGHGFGDRVLVAIAERLASTIGSRGCAARFGGDEFTVLMEESGDQPESFSDVGALLVRAFHRPLNVEGHELLVGVSVGAAFFPEHGDDAESLLSAADAALFKAKALGRGQLAIFTPELLHAAAARFTTEQGLRHAVERGELELAFQPELDMASMEVTLCEALLRWRRADGTLLGPDHFLTVAEESGLIVEINDWVLRSAVAAAARWRLSGLQDLRVAVNASARQLSDPAFAKRVEELLAEHGLPPAALEIELTETVLQTGADMMAGLNRLHQIGVTVALDDFGAGYSSLASLQQLPLSRVKLDRSLIAGIDGSGRSAAVAHAIIQLCSNLGVQVTAEGVERPTQLEWLRDSGVTVQGFLISRPVAESQLGIAVTRLLPAMESLLLSAPSPPRPLAATGFPALTRTATPRRQVTARGARGG